MRVIRTLIAVLLLACIVACGQKGPLYLPDAAPAVPVESENDDEKGEKAGEDNG